MANNEMNGSVTIASVRAHGVRQLLVYCLGKREGDWPCHHQGTLPVGRFRADEVLRHVCFTPIGTDSWSAERPPTRLSTALV